MKKIILLVGIFAASLVFAQNEQPAELDSKDLMDEVVKPDFDDDNVDLDLDHFIPKMEMPVLVPQMDSEDDPVVESKKVKKPVEQKPKESSEKSPAKIVNATTDLNIQELHVNDLIRVEFSQLKVYRRDDDKILKYKFRGGLVLESKGLSKKDESSYYVKDTSILIRDTKQAIAEKEKQQNAEVESSVESIQQVVETNTESDDANIIAQLRSDIEERLNYGKPIKDEVDVRGLRTNDLIYVIGDTLLVTRKNKATSGTKKFWLIEDIDFENPNLEKEDNNRYKVIRKIKD
jgi:hypothetical protein